MDQLDFEPQPARKMNPARFFVFGGVLFVALVAVVAAVVLPGMKTDDRSKATNTASCSGSLVAPAAVCMDQCMSDDDCTSGLKCLSVGTAADSRCRNPLNKESTTCTSPGTPTPPVATTMPGTTPTKPPTAGLPTAPPGCVYQQVQCIKAPCDPILICSSPTPVPTKVPATSIPVPKHTVMFVFHRYSDGQNMVVDFIRDGATVVDDSSSSLTYAGNWFKGSDSNPYGGAYAATSADRSAVSYVTTSKNVSVRTFRYYTRGGLDIYVDGVLKQQVNDLNSGSGWVEIPVIVSN